MDQRLFQKKFVQIFEENKAIRAVARFLAIFVATVSFVAFLFRIKSWFSDILIHSMISVVALFVAIYSIQKIINRVYGKIIRETSIFQHPVLSYRTALLRSIRLSAIDDSYFIAVTWLKASRIISSLCAISFLTIYYLKDNHTHKMIFPIFNYEYSVHELLDYTVVLSIFSLIVWVSWQLAEINMIALGTARLVNKRKNALVRRRVASRLSTRE